MVKETVGKGFVLGKFIHFGVSSWCLVDLCVSRSLVIT